MSKRGENIYKRKDGRWEGRLKMDSGKYQYIYGKNYKDVKEKIKQCVQIGKDKKKQTQKMSQSKCSLSETFEYWLKNYACIRVKPSTLESYYCCIKKYIIPFFMSIQQNQLTEFHIKQFVNAINNNISITDTYKRKILSIFKTAVRDMLKDAVNYKEIIDAVRLPKTSNAAINVFSVNEQKRIEREILNKGNNEAVGIMLCFYTGIRLGELCALKWEHIDLESKTISIVSTVNRIKNFQQNGGKTILWEGTPKSRSSIRKIPLPDFLVDLLKKQKTYSGDGKNYLLSMSSSPKDPRTYQRQFKNLLVSTGVQDRKFHTIRHTFATRALEMGVDIKTLSEILGHSSVSITLNIYAHSMMEQKILAMEKMNVLHIQQMNITPITVGNTVKQA